MDPGEVGLDPDLKPLVLTYPQDHKPGATITLSADTSRVRIWRDASRSELLVGGSQSSRQWVVGSDTIPSQPVVEGVGGSDSLGDTSITLEASDATAFQAPRRSSTRSATTQATVAEVWIKRAGANGALVDVTQKLSKVIVGEEVALISQWGPEGFFGQQPTHLWDVPGQRVNNYVANNNTGTIHSLTPAMLASSFLDFHWVDGGDPANVNMGVRRIVTYNITALNGVVRPLRSHFDVVRPQVTVTATSQGAAGVQVFTQPQGDDGRTRGVMKFEGAERPGIEFRAPPAQRQLPAGFGGTFQWVQVLRGGASIKNAQGGWHHSTYPIWNALDTSYPYNNRQDDATDSPAQWTFAPAAVKMQKDTTYEMHYMFTSDRPGSIAVPMKKVVWTWGGTATWDGAKWEGAGLFATEQPVAQDTTTHPQWSVNHLSVGWSPALLPGMF